MILQALTRHYETLLRRGEIAAPGWGVEKVSLGLNLGDGGEVRDLLFLELEQPRGGKMISAPQLLKVPAPVKRSNGAAANFLCDNAGYLLGIGDRGAQRHAKERFAACRALHEKLLSGVEEPAARAVCAFFRSWEPERAGEHPAVAGYWDRLMRGANLLLYYKGTPLTEFPAVCRAWLRHFEEIGDGPVMTCLVTGERGPVEAVHPAIKGVRDARASGAALVSFNAPALESFGHTQNINAPVGKYAAFAYTSALNHLLADRDHSFTLGDMTVVCWAESGEHAYQSLSMWSLTGGTGRETFHESRLLAAVRALASGNRIDWDGVALSPDEHFYILALAPNAARLSVRFFLQDGFGAFLRRVEEHHARLEIVKPAFDSRVRLTVWSLLRELVNGNSRDKKPPQQLAGDMLRAILTGARYPATLLNGVHLRIRAEHEITRGRAAIIKAYYLQNRHPECPGEVLKVGLNEESRNIPYTLGRLFAVLEAIQELAAPGLNATIKDKYFNSAAAAPATVFPTLMNLAQKHLRKIGGGLRVVYDRRLGELAGVLGEAYPARLSLAEQGSFQLGYYHQRQKRFEKKEEQADA